MYLSNRAMVFNIPLEIAVALFTESNETKTKKFESVLGPSFLAFVDFLQ